MIARPGTDEPSLRKDRVGRPFDRILIANRGEIAVRIIRTCRDLGIETVAVYSDADASAAHVLAADHAIRIGPAPAGESYLRGEAIVEVARSRGAQAIHPGYGFLSERASFARATTEAGLVFIGPSADAIDALGDKIAARRTAAAVGVPVVPGTLEPARTDQPEALATVLADAARIGFPLLVKAAAGGGGRGMRRVESATDLPAALSAAMAEADAAFGDGTVYLEREIRSARHIEVQLLGDILGTVVAIGERDCSIQRRHQKLVEESPAPGLTAGEREHLHAMAVRAASAARLHNAATAEFLFDGDRAFWFLEVNARLQVEHGVTELVTGLDLVAEQLWIAAGSPLSEDVLSAASHAVDPKRHAIEIRLSAEDPARGFAPAPGTVGRWRMPSGPTVRVDTAVREGDRIPPDYDPLLAKILTVGPDRSTAMARMRRVLAEVEVTGIQTTLPFDRALLSDPMFAAPDGWSTDWVTERWDGPADRARAFETAVVAASNVTSADEPIAATSLHKDASPSGWRTPASAGPVRRWPR